MATIGTVTKHDDGHYEGELRTLSIRADIAIVPVTDKAAHNQPDFRVLLQGRRDRCRLAAPGPDVGEGVCVPVDLRSRAGLQDALCEPRPGCG